MRSALALFGSTSPSYLILQSLDACNRLLSADYPARLQECCDRLEYEGSMMYDEYPDRLSLLRKSQKVWERAQKGENFGENDPQWEQVRDLIGVLLLQEMLVRRKKKRRR